MGVLDTLSALGTAGTGIGAVGSFGAGIVGGILQNKQAEKAQAFQEEWMQKMWEAEQQQQEAQNQQTEENLKMNKSAQYFNQQLQLRNEARQNTSDWHGYMQDAANKYAEVLNKSRALRKGNAAALRNR